MKKRTLPGALLLLLLVVGLVLFLRSGMDREPTPPTADLPAESIAPTQPDDGPTYGDGEDGPLYTDGGSEDWTEAGETWLDEDGTYSSMEDVALYLHQYGQLPDNFITKNEARDLGWPGGGLEDYAPGKCIGGDTFGNREGLLPDGTYHECDIDTLGETSRGAQRLVWDQDGNIYYTADHYESFELIYSAEDGQ